MRIHTHMAALLSAMAVLALGATLGRAQSVDDSYRRVQGRDCPIADMPLDSAGGGSVAYIQSADTSAAGWEELAAVEFGVWGRFGYWENESGADFSLEGLWDTMLLDISGPESDQYPLTMGRVRLQWTQRFEANYTFEGELSPGLYSGLDSLEGDDFSVPVGGRWIVPLTPDFAWFAGAMLYPTFDQVIDPRLGIRYARRDALIIDLGYPETRIVVNPGPRFRCSAGARWQLWPEYGLGDDPRERLRYDELRLYGTLEFGLTEYTRLAIQGGGVFQREVEFEAEADAVEIDDALFAGIGLTRAL